MITFDANILFYAVDHREASKQARCLKIIEAAESQGGAFVMLQALGEFVHAAVRKNLLPRPVAIEAARDWARKFDVRSAGAEAFETALDWWADERLSYWDALLVATASKGGAGALVSEDMQDGLVIGGVEIVDPFGDAAAKRLSEYGLKL